MVGGLRDRRSSRSKGARQEAQGLCGNAQLSSWAALDMGNEGKTKCV